MSLKEVDLAENCSIFHFMAKKRNGVFLLLWTQYRVWPLLMPECSILLMLCYSTIHVSSCCLNSNVYLRKLTIFNYLIIYIWGLSTWTWNPSFSLSHICFVFLFQSVGCFSFKVKKSMMNQTHLNGNGSTIWLKKELGFIYLPWNERKASSMLLLEKN